MAGFLNRWSHVGRVTIAGIGLACPHCRSTDRFAHKRAKLATPVLAALDMEAWNADADVFRCGCGHLSWFLLPDRFKPG